jgi:hypothetical protein
MAKTPSIENRIDIVFKGLERRTSTTAFPSLGHLSSELNSLADKAERANVECLNVTPKITSLYATAAVEIWLRGVHSFLISSSLTNVSPIWASVSGYYASHYCVRGLAHLLGFFQLYRKKRTARIEIEGGKYCCYIEKKGGADREHKYYWKIIKSNVRFEDDPFFTLNEEDTGDSDSGHRNIANYYDHINGFPNFHPLSEETLTKRIGYLSKIELSSVPIPRKEKYPDIENVQLIAYHRIIKFRSFLDEILGRKSRFWSTYRNPIWCADFLNFQVIKPRFVEIYQSKI